MYLHIQSSYTLAQSPKVVWDLRLTKVKALLRPTLPNLTDWHIKYQYNLKTNTILINQTAECMEVIDTKKCERSREAGRKRRPRLRTGEAAAEADAVEARLRPSRA